MRLAKRPTFITPYTKNAMHNIKMEKHMSNQYLQIREITRIQSLVISEYQKVWWLLQKDPNFSATELEQMSLYYQCILASSLTNIDLLIHVISSFATSMTDGQRLKLIKNIDSKIQKNSKVLRRYNIHNCLTSLQRANSIVQKDHLKRIYGLNK